MINVTKRRNTRPAPCPCDGGGEKGRDSWWTEWTKKTEDEPAAMNMKEDKAWTGSVLTPSASASFISNIQLAPNANDMPWDYILRKATVRSSRLRADWKRLQICEIAIRTIPGREHWTQKMELYANWPDGLVVRTVWPIIPFPVFNPPYCPGTTWTGEQGTRKQFGGTLATSIFWES